MAWEQIDEDLGLWTAEYRVPIMKARSSALRLPGGGYLVVSPGAGLEGEFGERVGVPEVLLLPNTYHHLGVPAWREAFPEAVVAASAAAHGRLAKQGQVGLRDLEAVRSRLDGELSFLEPPGTKVGEVWLRAQGGSGVSWLVGDAFFNMKDARSLRLRLLQRVLRSAPGLSVSQVMKWFGLRDRKAFKSWVLERLDQDAPRRLVPLHGDVLESDDLPDQLRALLARRL